MKKLLLAALLSATTSLALAADFSITIRRTNRAPASSAANEQNAREGGIQRAARMGQTLQAVNPLAPAAYGTGANAVENRGEDPMLKSHDHSREHPIALRLFSIEF